MPVWLLITGSISMITGTRISAFLFGLLLIGAGSLYADTGLQEVMAGFSTISKSESRYTEEKHYEMLDVPIVQQGLLEYQAPEMLAWSRGKDSQSRYEIREDQMIDIRNGKVVRSMALDGLPAVRAFVESFRATLAGDEARLRQYYALEFSGGADHWQLKLSPRDQDMKRFIDHIQLEGEQNQLRVVEIHEADGDWSHMELEPIRQEQHAQ
jgi:hypothetical protein